MGSYYFASPKGETADLAKPMKGLGSGVFEIAFQHHTDAYRVIYAVQIGEDLWVIHAFQKKAKKGIATPKKNRPHQRQNYMVT